MKKSIIALALSCLALSINAQEQLNVAQEQTLDPKFTLGVGKTRGYTQGSGTWWQKEYPHYFQKTSDSAVVRLDLEPNNNWSWSYGIGYVHIGNFNSDALAVASDYAYEQHKPYPLSRWIGNQKMDGIFAVTRYTKNKWYVEFGPIYQRTSWSMYIPDWVPCVEDIPRTCVIPDIANMRPFTTGNPDTRIWNVILGAGYQFNDNWGTQVMLYPTYVRESSNGPGLLQMYSPTFSVMYTF